MIKIEINQEPQNYELEGLLDKNYTLNTTIAIDENANLTQVMSAVIKALKIEGYNINSKILHKVIDELVDFEELEEAV